MASWMQASFSPNLKDKDMRLTEEEFNEIWEVLGKSRANTKELKVPRQALINVMMDHSKFYGHCFPNLPTKQKLSRTKRRALRG